MAEPLAILFEDAHVLAVVKPAGLATQGPPADELTLEAAVRQHLDPKAPDSVYLGTVHRLDRPVSGVIVWAKTLKAARRLAAQFASREASKEYWAIVEARTQELGDQGTWDDWLTPPDSSGLVQSVAPDVTGARRAITRFQRGQAAQIPEGTAWLRLWPETGRTHQLRVQASRRGLPIVGDITYGSDRTFPAGIALHARVLGVRHPILQSALELIAPLPLAWERQGIILPETPFTGS